VPFSRYAVERLGGRGAEAEAETEIEVETEAATNAAGS